jgi:hypothetical protein
MTEGYDGAISIAKLAWVARGKSIQKRMSQSSLGNVMCSQVNGMHLKRRKVILLNSDLI